MNKKEQITKLTWEYFWEQKFKEVGLTILILSILIFVPYFLGSWIGDGKSDMCGDGSWGNDYEVECGTFATWFEGLFYLIVISLVLLLLGAWILENWEKAKEKAREEVK